VPDLNTLGVAAIPDPRYVRMTNMHDLTNNKQRGQLCTLVLRREKRKKNTNNQSLVTIQPLFVYTCHTMWKRARLHI